ncbi:MAG: hypothetical protein K1X53_03750 [Candidatus Sumerlaeaceae bacterium]|nr:hypothetical protein [Candidatus Sumerlaeaceae bacterium]
MSNRHRYSSLYCFIMALVCISQLAVSDDRVRDIRIVGSVTDTTSAPLSAVECSVVIIHGGRFRESAEERTFTLDGVLEFTTDNAASVGMAFRKKGFYEEVRRFKTSEITAETSEAGTLNVQCNIKMEAIPTTLPLIYNCSAVVGSINSNVSKIAKLWELKRANIASEAKITSYTQLVPYSELSHIIGVTSPALAIRCEWGPDYVTSAPNLIPWRGRKPKGLQCYLCLVSSDEGDGLILADDIVTSDSEYFPVSSAEAPSSGYVHELRVPDELFYGDSKSGCVFYWKVMGLYGKGSVSGASYQRYGAWLDLNMVYNPSGQRDLTTLARRESIVGIPD